MDTPDRRKLRGHNTRSIPAPRPQLFQPVWGWGVGRVLPVTGITYIFQILIFNILSSKFIAGVNIFGKMISPIWEK